MPSKRRNSKEIQDLVEELRSWLPNYEHGPNSFPTALYRILAAMPGGDQLEDMGYEPISDGIGWHEADILKRVLEACENANAVEDLVEGLTAEEEEDEEEEEVDEEEELEEEEPPPGLQHGRRRR